MCHSSIAMQELSDTGKLRVDVRALVSSYAIAGATVKITWPDAPEQVLAELTTDENGQTESLELPAPPAEYSQQPDSERPYSVFNLSIQAEGYQSLKIAGAEILSGELAIQRAALMPLTSDDSQELYVIPPHTLYGDYPPKISESEIKELTASGEVVLSRVVIPSGVRNRFIAPLNEGYGKW